MGTPREDSEPRIDAPDANWGESADATNGEGPRYVLRLYVTGMTARSQTAIAATKAICEEFLGGRYALEVIDITRHPEVTQQEQIIASPTLVKQLPLPLRRLVGDLSRRDRVLAGLGLHETT